MKQKDRRIKLMNQVLAGVKVRLNLWINFWIIQEILLFTLKQNSAHIYILHVHLGTEVVWLGGVLLSNCAGYS